MSTKLTVEEALNLPMVKFVRVAGEYRFCDVHKQHSSLIGCGLKALSAGTLTIKPNIIKITEGTSWSLGGVSADTNDPARLGIILGREVIFDLFSALGDD